MKIYFLFLNIFFIDLFFAFESKNGNKNIHITINNVNTNTNSNQSMINNSKEEKKDNVFEEEHKADMFNLQSVLTKKNSLILLLLIFIYYGSFLKISSIVSFFVYIKNSIGKLWSKKNGAKKKDTKNNKGNDFDSVVQ